MLPLCLISPGRSGSTALIHSLAAHPEVVACLGWPHEQRPACKLIGRLVSAPETIPERIAAIPQLSIIQDPFRSDETREAQLFQEQVLPLLAAGVAGGLQGYYREEAEEQGKAAQFFVEKTPFFLLAPILEVFGEALTVVLVRDPRDAMASAYEFFGRQESHGFFIGPSKNPFENLLTSYGEQWTGIEAMLTGLRQLASNLVLVRYEDMVSDPNSFFEKLLGKLKLDTVKGAPACAAAYQDGLTRGSHRTSSSAKESIGIWQTKLDKAQIDLLHSHLDSACRYLGYQ